MANGSGIAYLAAVASQEIEALSQALARLPGLGPRSARRAVLHLMKRRETALQPLLSALRTVSDKLSTCSTCGNVDTSDPCSICKDPKRDDKALCVVEEVVRPVGARPLAPVSGPLSRARRPSLGARRRAARGPHHRPAGQARRRRRHRRGGAGDERHVEGQTTAHYLAERLEGFPIRISQLAHGLPVGGELDYLDEGTLAQALRARRPIS